MRAEVLLAVPVAASRPLVSSALGFGLVTVIVGAAQTISGTNKVVKATRTSRELEGAYFMTDSLSMVGWTV